MGLESFFGFGKAREQGPSLKVRALKIAIGLVLGGAAGFAYYSYVGCATGGCPITSSPVVSTAWGAMIGGLLGMT